MPSDSKKESPKFLLEARNIEVTYKTRRGLLKALSGVSLYLKQKEVLGIVGESGCGKTTLARTITTIIKPDLGEVLYKGENAFEMPPEKRFSFIQMIFQDPYSSLNPRMKVGDIIAEGPLNFGLIENKKKGHELAKQLLKTVDLPEEFVNRYPHQLSGGQRQRVGIARALAVEPEVIVADEPVSALDVSVQAQILNLLKRLTREKNFSLIYISHDLGTVRFLSTRVMVMYAGSVVEESPTEELFEKPLHPYTKALIDSVPSIKREIKVIAGEPPDPVNLPPGCPFINRCPRPIEQCSKSKPKLKEVYTNNRTPRKVACHNPIF